MGGLRRLLREPSPSSKLFKIKNHSRLSPTTNKHSPQQRSHKFRERASRFPEKRLHITITRTNSFIGSKCLARPVVFNIWNCRDGGTTRLRTRWCTSYALANLAVHVHFSSRCAVVAAAALWCRGRRTSCRLPLLEKRDESISFCFVLCGIVVWSLQRTK